MSDRPTKARRVLADERRSGDWYYQRRWWTLSVLCLSLVLTAVANTSMNLTLPTLVKTLHASGGQLQWIVDVYSLVFAGLLLTAGALGDRYGRKGALTMGLLIFAGASALAAVSQTAGQLIAARALMGVGAAFVMPATLSILAHVFPPGERARAVAIWAGCAGAGAAGGSIVCGWLLQTLWWGSIFLINVVVVVVAITAGHVLVPASGERIRTRLDPAGALFSTGGLGALVFAIIEGPELGWGSTTTTIGFAAAAVLLVAFGVWEWRSADPMLDLRLFRRRRFAAATTTITVIFFAMYGTQFLLSQYLQLVLGYDPLQAGVRMLPIPLAFMAAAPLSARLVERNGQRRVVVLGLLLLAAGLVLLSRTGVHADYLYLAICLAVIASGMGLTTAPSTAAIMESLPLPKAGVGSAVNDTTRELGGALGVAVLGSLMASRFRSGLASGTQHVSVSQSLGDALARAATLPPSAGSTLARSARHAYVGASGFTLQVAAAGIGLTAVAVASLLRPDRLGTATSAVEAADAGCDRRVA